jgi:hypothetical protein
MATDATVLASINDLAAEERRLQSKESDRTATDHDRQRAADIEIELDRCWDLLRQRQARRSAGLDPDDAALRSETIVEHYLQ